LSYIFIRDKYTKLLLITTLGSGLLSGVVSNTGTVATLMPVTISSAWSIGTLPSKLLMPVAFGSNTGGLLTLTGTPPNIIVNNTMLESGLEGFSFFEFALIGLPLLLIALLYFRFIGYRLLPNNKTNNKPVDKLQRAKLIKLTFGKYSGKTLGEIFNTDRRYFDYLKDKGQDPNLINACKYLENQMVS
jgi:di/tricarboxylate transporter